jgi:HK97 family phage major capsid protein
MATSLARVVRAVAAEIWAIEQGKLETICGFLEAAAEGNRMSVAEARELFGASRRDPMRAGKVAVLPLYGTISQRMSMLGAMSGGTSTESFGQAFDAAVSDPEVSAIVIDCDSPGGTVTGVPELAAKIHAARGTKPIVAQVNGLCASAAYWICSQADEVVGSVSSEAGSIGVFMVHTDISEAAEKAGVKHTIIKAGDHKAEGNPYEPLSEESREYLEGEVADIYGMFLADVAKGRGVSVSDVRENFGKGRTMRAKQAKRAGMLDRVATLDQTLARFGVKPSASRVQAENEAPPLSLAAMDVGDGTWTEAACNDGIAARRIAAADIGSGIVGYYAVNAEPDAGGAAPDNAEPPATEPAPEARSDVMSENGQATPANGVNALETAQRILTLARSHGMPEADAQALAFSPGQTEATASTKILEFVASKASGAVTVGTSGAVAGVSAGTNRAHLRPFENFGEQLQAVAMAGGADIPGMNHLRGDFVGRLNELQAAVTGHSAGVGADGGFLVGTDSSSEILRRAYDASQLASRCTVTPIGENADGLETFYVDETSRVAGSRGGGVRVYRAAEAGDVTASQMKLGRFELRLEDMVAATYLTERLLQDAPALQAEVQQSFEDEFSFTIDNEIFRGTGVGQCHGVINHGSWISVAKETGQLADTVQAENVQKIWARVPARSQMSGVWVYNTALFPQLQNMQIGTGASGQLVFMPAGGLSGAPHATIYGRPALPIEQASAPGDVGDLAFLDLSQYKLIVKGGMKFDESIHVRFLNNERVFRFVTRINGKPKFPTALTPANGTDTLSPFVGIAAR